MATPEQIQQALAALAQAASASAGGQLRPEDLAALFGPQWATLVAMPGGLVALPPNQLQQLAAFEAPGAPAVRPTHAHADLPSAVAPAAAWALLCGVRSAWQQPPAAAQAQTVGCCVLHSDSAVL